MQLKHTRYGGLGVESPAGRGHGGSWAKPQSPRSMGNFATKIAILITFHMFLKLFYVRNRLGTRSVRGDTL